MGVKRKENKLNLNIENRTVGLNIKPLEPRRFIGNKRLYQYGALFVAIIMVFSSIGYATIKLGEDGSGQKWFGDDTGLITNSNGKAWTATGANLQAAIWDLNSTGGSITLPEGDITTLETLLINLSQTPDLVIKGQGHQTRLITSGAFNAINLSSYHLAGQRFQFKDFQIEGNDVGLVGIHIRDEFFDGGHVSRCEMENLRIRGFVTFGVNDSADWGVFYDNCWIETNGGGTSDTGGIMLYQTNCPVLSGCRIESNRGSGVLCTLGYGTVICDGTVIEANNRHGLYVYGGTQDGIIRDTQFEVNNMDEVADIYDIYLKDTTTSYWTIDSCRASGTKVNYSIKSDGWFTTVHSYRTLGSGNDISATYYSAFPSFQWSCNVTFKTAKTVEIDSVLKLTPRSDSPTPAYEGMIYYDDTYNKLRLYNDTGWFNVTVS